MSKSEIRSGQFSIWKDISIKHFVTNYIDIFYKKEGQTVMLSAFLENHKNPETEIFVFCVITFDPITI